MVSTTRRVVATPVRGFHPSRVIGGRPVNWLRLGHEPAWSSPGTPFAAAVAATLRLVSSALANPVVRQAAVVFDFCWPDPRI
jgi:hypothetical protein